MARETNSDPENGPKTRKAITLMGLPLMKNDYAENVDLQKLSRKHDDMCGLLNVPL